MTAARVERLRAELESLGISTFLVTNPINVRYLTGFASTNAALLVGPDRLLLCTDGRYLEAAKAVEGVEVLQAERDLALFLGGRLPELAEPPVGFESGYATYAAFDALGSGGVELRPVVDLVEGLRAAKDTVELDGIRAAARTTAAAVDRLSRETLTGRTEAEVAGWLAQALYEAGADGVAFPPIVGSGPNGAVPHHHSGERVIKPGETVVVDLGGMLRGFYSDCTRTFATGPLGPELEEAYELCREVQAEALDAVRPGASAREVDALARERIAAAGHRVLHGLGHGVGLALQERPRLSDTSDAVLEAGNVVTVEPGVYLPGVGGIRIEDLVIVTEDGPEILTPFRKDLVTLA